MSTIADYSVFTKAFLASEDVDFSKLYGEVTVQGGASGFRAFAVVPLKLDTPLTPREALNFDWSKLSGKDMQDYVSCSDADGNFIGNIVRVQPGVREGSIRLVAKVAVPTISDKDVDTSVNTFVLLRTDASTSTDLPIAVATISKGYMLHKHLITNGRVPLDDVKNASYVSFTINNLNGYTSVDFNPDAYATYDVTDALSRRVDVLEGKEGIEGLHLAFNSNTGDIILSDSKGNVIDQANLHLDLSTDTIIAEGEEGYKYVKTDRNQDIHSAKAFMAPPVNSPYTSAFGKYDEKAYTTVSASLVRVSGDNYVCNGIRVRWEQAQEGSEPAPKYDKIFYVFLTDGNGSDGTETGKKYLAWNSFQHSDSELTQDDPKLFHTASGNTIEVSGDSAIYSGNPTFNIAESVYDHDAFVHTVGNSSLADWDECFQLMGFHKGDDIPLGTDLPTLMQALTDGKVDPEAWIHGAGSNNAEKVAGQRELAKNEMVEYNKRRPALTENRQSGTIIDHRGLDVRDGSITLGCGRVGAEDANTFQKVNYGIQMKDRSSDPTISGRSESLDFTISHHTGLVKFDANGHAAQTGGNEGLVPLTSSTLLSIEAGSYISGAPTCLILAEVTHNSGSEGGPTVLTPVRMTAGFLVEQSYDASSGLTLTLKDLRDNIKDLLNHDGNTGTAPAIVEVQAIYTHHNAETVPAQQMHTYIGSWNYGEQQPQPTCSFLCNKIEEWMTAVGLADTNPSPDPNPAADVKLYVVIRVY